MGDAKTRKKPPIDKQAIRARIADAQQRQALVRVRRWIPDADQREGFVVATSRRWVLLATLSDRITLDGWTALRVKDVQAVTVDPEEDCFEVRALQARGQWPPRPADGLDLSALPDLLRSAAAVEPMVSVYREFERPDACWIGAPLDVSDSVLSLLEVNVAGGWARKPRRFDLDDITRVDLGGGYEEALSLVAGPPPTK
jgi:hypothetical protein